MVSKHQKWLRHTVIPTNLAVQGTPPACIWRVEPGRQAQEPRALRDLQSIHWEPGENRVRKRKKSAMAPGLLRRPSRGPCAAVQGPGSRAMTAYLGLSSGTRAGLEL